MEIMHKIIKYNPYSVDQLSYTTKKRKGHLKIQNQEGNLQ